ncbi:MerR family transcriptional regulator [Alkalihalobacterium alkalinitrilicum]|uniref:MerR family transcriptional regulator n=1 Tax=Alkalihalobacterium alkalinitrilicum TaxID=427920 RepID=UPI001302F890|nr:MerR family transcriptional regulator [Alkalihalobacterium alkalinitrilicum]
MANEINKYSTKEVSKLLKIPIGNLRKWERTFEGMLYVQRTRTGARLYTDYEIETLKKIKLLKDKNIKDDDVKYILETNILVEVNEEKEEIEDVEGEHRYETILSLQQETVESVEKLTNSIFSFRDEMIQETKEEIKNEVKKEIHLGHNKTTSLVQSYSQMLLDTSDQTIDEILKLRQEIERENEEKLFIHQKLEEREVHFQEFVQHFRETAATKQDQSLKGKVTKWFSYFSKDKKEDYC